MSLIDPSTRWWNRPRVRRNLAWTCWVVLMPAAFAAGWVFGMEFDIGYQATFELGGIIAILLVLLVLLLLAGAFLDILSKDSEADFNFRAISLPLAGMFLFQGLGHLAYNASHGLALDSTAVGFAVVGALGGLGAEIIIRKLQGNEALRQKVRRSGIVTQGTVTGARGYSENYTSVTRVTVSFIDHEQRKRWVSQTVGGTVRVGKKMTVRYSPADLGRRGGVVIDG